MKKLYRKGTVHPSPPTISDQLSFLPATILTLTVALSPEDREVLAYLISSNSFSSSSGNPRRAPKGVADGADHPALFHCSCFRCYMSYWVRWDSSPNHQLIHEIIDAFEEWLAQSNKSGGGGSSRKEKIQENKRGGGSSNNKSKRSELVKVSSPCKGSAEPELVLGETETSVNSSGSGGFGGGGGGGDVVEVGEGGGGVEDDEEKGSVRRFVSFIGERIWGAWGQ